MTNTIMCVQHVPNTLIYIYIYVEVLYLYLSVVHVLNYTSKWIHIWAWGREDYMRICLLHSSYYPEYSDVQSQIKSWYLVLVYNSGSDRQKQILSFFYFYTMIGFYSAKGYNDRQRK